MQKFYFVSWKSVGFHGNGRKNPKENFGHFCSKEVQQKSNILGKEIDKLKVKIAALVEQEEKDELEKYC